MSIKIAIVTGSNKGLGFAIVKGLCEEFQGLVYLTSRDENRGVEACKQLQSQGYEPRFHQLDVSDFKSIDRFCKYVKEKNYEVGILVNNAGVFFKDSKESFEFIAEETMKINYFGLVNLTESVLPFMKSGAKIINITSSSGHLSRIPSEAIRKRLKAVNLSVANLNEIVKEYLGCVHRKTHQIEGWGTSAYVVSKNAVNAYTFIMHRRLREDGISVNCLHPGYVKSDMTFGAGNKTPEEGAILPLYLALEAQTSGEYFWHNGSPVCWDGEDPRKFFDS